MILDWGHSARLDPVDLVSVARFVKNLWRAIYGLCRGSVAEQLLVLILRPVGELVVAELETVVTSIVLLDELVESAEIDQALFELSNRLEGLAEFGQVLHELHLNGAHGAGGTDKDCGSEGFHLGVFL